MSPRALSAQVSTCLSQLLHLVVMNASGVTPGHSSDSSPDAAHSDSAQHQCQWENCGSLFGRTEQLYIHLLNAHIGKGTNSNICLTCKWKDCNRSFARRNRFINHCRTIHSRLPPLRHVCKVCRCLRQHLLEVKMYTFSLRRCVVKHSS
jgi:hypothetical protein